MLIQNLFSRPRMMPDGDGTGGGEPSGDGAGVGDVGGSKAADGTAAGDASGIVVDNSNGGQDFSASIPDEYREKPYIKELLKSASPQTEVWKQFDNLQQKLGQRVDAPAAPESVDAYTLPDIDLGADKAELSKQLTEGRNAEYVGAMKQAALDAKLSPEQFATLAGASEKFSAGIVEANAKAAAEYAQALETGFADMAKTAFKGNQDKALERGKVALGQHFTSEQKALIGELDNKGLIALAVLNEALHAKYNKEDSVNGGGNIATGDTLPELRAAHKAAIEQNIIKRNEARSAYYPGHEEAQAQIAEYARRIDEANKRAGTQR